jgi:hypothetical protein
MSRADPSFKNPGHILAKTLIDRLRPFMYNGVDFPGHSRYLRLVITRSITILTLHYF